MSVPWLDHLLTIGVQPWLPRSVVVDEAVPENSTPPAAATTGAIDWDELAALVAGCERCELHRGRTQTVFGVGNRAARWMVIGEAPGAEEDKRGEPFVGRAGQLLDAMLAAIGLDRQQVYIANILKCRPPNNRDPRPEEVTCCAPYLQRQIELVAPELILAVGRIAAQNLLQVDTPIGRMRGQLFEYGPRRIPVIVTYHPAYLLRSPREKRKVWQDLLRARQLTQGIPV
ncbi:MAG: uracil-DNA glycosylase [Gammaproteobacteria bacterium]|nr:uracil-DNA glycosylase [Gammaproteobacteria bacterium]